MSKINIIIYARRMIQSGGVENYMFNTFKHFDKENYEFTFIIPDENRDGQAYLTEIEELGGKLVFIPSHAKSLFKHVYTLFNFLRNENNNSIFHVHASNGFHAIEGAIARISGIKHIIYHSHNASGLETKSIKFSRKIFGLFGTKYLACTKEAGEFLFGKKIVNGGNFMIAKNAINTKDFMFNQQEAINIRQELGIKKDETVLTYVGRISPEKNVDFLIKFFIELRKVNSGYRLLIVGEGEETDYRPIKKLSSELGNSIIFTGRRNDVTSILSASDFLLLPSQYESFGIVLIEAQTSGVKCFASKNVNPITNLTGQVEYLPLDIEIWKNEILSSNPNLSREGFRQIILDNGYDLANSVSELSRLYTSLVNGN